MARFDLIVTNGEIVDGTGAPAFRGDIGIIDERRTPAVQERAGWANAFGLPRVWRLMPDGRTLGQAPAPELEALRGAPVFHDTPIQLGAEPTRIGEGLLAYELLVEFDPSQGPGQPTTVDLLASADGREATRLTFDPVRGRVTVDKSASSLAGEDEGPLVLQGDYASKAFGDMRRLRVIVDGSAIEVFVNDAAAFAVRSYPSLAGSTQLRIGSPGDTSRAAKVSLWPLARPPG